MPTTTFDVTTDRSTLAASIWRAVKRPRLVALRPNSAKAHLVATGMRGLCCGLYLCGISVAGCAFFHSCGATRRRAAMVFGWRARCIIGSGCRSSHPEYPNFDSDDASSSSVPRTVVDISTRRVKRHTRPSRYQSVRAISAPLRRVELMILMPGHRDASRSGIARFIARDGTWMRFSILGDRVANQLCIDFQLANFFNVDAISQFIIFAKVRAQCFDIFTLSITTPGQAL